MFFELCIPCTSISATHVGDASRLWASFCAGLMEYAPADSGSLQLVLNLRIWKGGWVGFRCCSCRLVFSCRCCCQANCFSSVPFKAVLLIHSRSTSSKRTTTHHSPSGTDFQSTFSSLDPPARPLPISDLVFALHSWEEMP